MCPISRKKKLGGGERNAFQSHEQLTQSSFGNDITVHDREWMNEHQARVQSRRRRWSDRVLGWWPCWTFLSFSKWICNMEVSSWRDSLGLYEEGLEKTRRWLISSVQSSVGGVAKAMTWGAGRAKTWRPEHLWERFTKKKAKAITKETWNNNILFVTRTLLLGSHIPFPTKRNRDS